MCLQTVASSNPNFKACPCTLILEIRTVDANLVFQTDECQSEIFRPQPGAWITSPLRDAKP